MSDNFHDYDLDNFTEDYIQLLTEYFDELYSAINPFAEDFESDYHTSQKNFSNVKPNNYEPDLTNLINSLQRYTNRGNHCLRLLNKVLKFHYNFPHEKQELSSINYADNCYRFLLKGNDSYIQIYYKIVTLIQRANTDFLPIMGRNSIIRYIIKYTTKSETSQDHTWLISSINERDYSAQEVAHIMISWPMYYIIRI